MNRARSTIGIASAGHGHPGRLLGGLGSLLSINLGGTTADQVAMSIIASVASPPSLFMLPGTITHTMVSKQTNVADVVSQSKRPPVCSFRRHKMIACVHCVIARPLVSDTPFTNHSG